MRHLSSGDEYQEDADFEHLPHVTESDDIFYHENAVPAASSNDEAYHINSFCEH